MLDWMGELFNTFMQGLYAVLPLSPFKDFINSFSVPQGITWLNWFIDVAGMIEILGLWVTAYGLYLIYSVILRWVKAIS